MARIASYSALGALVTVLLCTLSQTEARGLLGGNVTVGGGYVDSLPRRGANHRLTLEIPDGDHYVIEAKWPRSDGELHMFASCGSPPSRQNYDQQAPKASMKKFSGVAFNVGGTNCTYPNQMHILIMAYQPTKTYHFSFRRLVAAVMPALQPVHRVPEEDGEKIVYMFTVPETDEFGDPVVQAQVVVEMTDPAARYWSELQIYVRRDLPPTLSLMNTRGRARDFSKPGCAYLKKNLYPGDTYYVMVDNWSGFAYRVMVQFNPFNCDFADAQSP